MNFEQMCQEAPELRNIRKDAERLLADEDDRNHWHYYEQLKSRMKRIVGWDADENHGKWFRSMEAYDVAHKGIFGGLA